MAGLYWTGRNSEINLPTTSLLLPAHHQFLDASEGGLLLFYPLCMPSPRPEFRKYSYRDHQIRAGGAGGPEAVKARAKDQW